MYVNYTYGFEMSLLCICRGMGLHVYIAQVSLWRSCEGGLIMIWIKYFMSKVVVKQRVLMWCYELCGHMSSYEWKGYDLLSMLCLV